MTTYKFPDGFKWGSATSAHQVEGGNYNDWTVWEAQTADQRRFDAEKRRNEFPEGVLKNYPSPLQIENYISGRACDSYNRYEEDFDIAKKLNQNIHRFSIEWSRIEPEEGKFDGKEIEHYKRLINALKERGIEPMVSLWHFTNPIWFAEKGGFLNQKSPEYFTRYVKYVVDNLKDRVGLWITFNEPINMYGGLAYLKGEWPPQHRNLLELLKLRRNLVKAHILAYRSIKEIYSVFRSQNHNSLTSHNVVPQIGVIETNRYPVSGKVFNFSRRLFIEYRNLYFWRKVAPHQDFIGFNYYTLFRLPGSYKIIPQQNIAEEMNWEIYPEGIYHVLKDLNKFKKPIYITENGIADGTDRLRDKFIKEHLYWIWRAIQDGADVRGYMYWSLLDNFEWAHGFAPRFGLVEMDYTTLERKIRPSAYEYAKICKDNMMQIRE